MSVSNAEFIILTKVGIIFGAAIFRRLICILDEPEDLLLSRLSILVMTSALLFGNSMMVEEILFFK